MKKNNMIKRTMAGALAMVSVAAYMPVSAAVPVLSNVAMVASAADYTSGQSVRASSLKAGDILYAGAVVQPYNDNGWSYLQVLNESGSTIKGSSHSNYTIPEGKKFEVVSTRSYDGEGTYYQDWSVTLREIGKVEATFPGDTVVSGINPTGSVYTLSSGTTYTAYSNFIIKSPNSNVVGVSREDGEFNVGGKDYAYKYTLTVKDISQNYTDFAFIHSHALGFYSSTSGDETNRVYLKCDGEANFEPKVVAELDLDDVYYYGEIPTEGALKYTLSSEDSAEYGVTGYEMRSFSITAVGSNVPLGKDKLQAGNDYVANATITITYGNGQTNQQAVWQQFTYEKRPLEKCSIFYREVVDGETKLTPAVPNDQGIITIPAYTYNKKEQGPDIVILNAAGEDITDLVNIVAEGDEKNRATDVGNYSYRLVAKDNTNYAGDLTVSWAIDSANSGINIKAKEGRVYNGKEINLADDFTITGDNADLVKGDGVQISSYYVLGGGNGIDATENGTIHFDITIPNFQPVSLNVPYTIAKRPVTLSPKAGEITYGDNAPASVAYDVEKFDEKNNRGFVEGDLAEGQTANQFFGEQFVVGTRADGTNGIFRYDGGKNNAGTYNFSQNAPANINAAGKISNYDINCLTVANAEEDEKVAVFTVNKKLLAEEMFTLYGGIDSAEHDPTFVYKEARQHPEMKLDDGKFGVNSGASLITEDKLTLSDVDIYGTSEAVFPCEEDNPYYVEFVAKEDSNYTGKVKVPWWIIEDSTTYTQVGVTADDFGYDGTTIEAHKALTVDAGTYPDDAKLSYAYYSIDKNGGLTKLSGSPTEAGNYKVEVTATKRGYKTITGSDNYTIKADEIKVIVDSDDLSKVFGDPDPNFDASVYEISVAGANKDKDVKVSGNLKLKNCKGNVGVYEFDTSGLTVTVDGKDETSSFAVKVDDTFTITRRRLLDENIVPKSAVFALTGIATTTDGFYVVAKGADGNDTILVEGADYELITGHLTQEEANAFSIQIGGLGNYMGYAESAIKVGEGYKVTVNGGNFATGKAAGNSEWMFVKGDTTTVKPDPDAIPEGMKFGYWKDETGKTVSWNESYAFVVGRDGIELEAVYIENEDDIEKYAQARIDSAEKVVEDGVTKLQVVSKLSVPTENYKIVKGGLIATSDANKAKTLDATNADYIKTDTTDKHNLDYTWKKKDVKAGDKWYVKAYLVYKDANGDEVTMYGALVEASFDGVKVLEKAAIQTITEIDSAEGIIDTDGKPKAQFVARLTVPGDCTIEAAGLIAADEILSKDEFVVDNAKIDYIKAEPSDKHTVIYTWKKNRDDVHADTWYVRSYLVFRDSEGEKYTVYGDEIATATIPSKS